MLYKYDYSDNSKYYSKTRVLVNKLGIRNQKRLSRVERKMTKWRAIQLSFNPIKGSFDLEHLKKIHYYLFQDMYDWAGQIRTHNIYKNGVCFCFSGRILDAAEAIFKQIKNEHFFINYDYQTKLLKLMEVFSDLNALHPFYEGNGRTQRIFVEWLARIAGINIVFKNISKIEMIIASYDAINGQYDDLFTILKNNSYPISEQEQLIAIKELLADEIQNSAFFQDATQKTFKQKKA